MRKYMYILIPILIVCLIGSYFLIRNINNHENKYYISQYERLFKDNKQDFENVAQILKSYKASYLYFDDVNDHLNKKAKISENDLTNIKNICLKYKITDIEFSTNRCRLLFDTVLVNHSSSQYYLLYTDTKLKSTDHILKDLNDNFYLGRFYAK